MTKPESSMPKTPAASDTGDQMAAPKKAASGKTAQSSASSALSHQWKLEIDGLRLGFYDDLGNMSEPTADSVPAMRTKLDYDEFMGTLLRRFPDRSLQPFFLEVIQKLSNPLGPRGVGVLGKHAAGKTYGAHTLSRLISGEDAVVINCADKNLQDLLYKATFKNGEIEVVEGELLSALKELKKRGGGVVLMNEKVNNKGSDKVLNEFMEMIASSDPDTSMVVHFQGSTETRTLKRSDLGADILVMYDGNLSADSGAEHTNSQSFDSRAKARLVTQEFEEDWLKRYFQELTGGIPVSRILEANPEYLSDEKNFARILTYIRYLALDENKKAAVPEYQLRILQNWKNYQRGLKKITNFWLEFEQMVAKPSFLQRVRTSELKLDESDLTNMWNVNKRLIRDHVAAALTKSLTLVPIEMSSKVVDTKKSPEDIFKKPTITDKRGEYDPLENFGDEFCKWIVDFINGNTVGADPELAAAQKEFMHLAQKHGVIPPEDHANRNDEPTIAELLNFRTKDNLAFDANLQELMEEIAAYYKEMEPAKLGNIPTEDLINAGELQLALDRIRKEINKDPDFYDRVIAVNPDYLQQESREKAAPLSIVDMFRINADDILKIGDKGVYDRLLNNALTLEEMVLAMGMSCGLGQDNTAKLWEGTQARLIESMIANGNGTQALTPEDLKNYEWKSDDVPFTKIYKNLPTSKIGFSSFSARRNAKSDDFVLASVLQVKNEDGKPFKTIIFSGTPISKTIADLAAANGTVFVQITAQTTAAQLKKTIDEIIGYDLTANKEDDFNGDLNECLEKEYADLVFPGLSTKTDAMLSLENFDDAQEADHEAFLKEIDAIRDNTPFTQFLVELHQNRNVIGRPSKAANENQQNRPYLLRNLCVRRQMGPV